MKLLLSPDDSLLCHSGNQVVAPSGEAWPGEWARSSIHSQRVVTWMIFVLTYSFKTIVRLP